MEHQGRSRQTRYDPSEWDDRRAVTVMPQHVSPFEIEAYKRKLSDLVNHAHFEKAYALSRSLQRRYPGVLEFAYWEAVMSAEDDTGYTPAEIRARHRAAAQKLRKLLRRVRSASPRLRSSIRNEYHWFSHQPRKQFLLGQERVKRGEPRAHYSKGVGAAELAKKYGLEGRTKLCVRWAKRSEKAWLEFFKVDADWYNSYFFYAMALGCQGRLDEARTALARAARIAGKSTRWQAIRDQQREIEKVCAALRG